MFGKWPDDYIKQDIFKFVDFHGPVNQTEAPGIYYDAKCCLNLCRDFYSETGFTVNRMADILDCGCILLLDSDFYKGSEIVSEHFIIKDRKDLDAKLKWIDAMTYEQRAAIVEQQMAVFKKFTIEHRVDLLLGHYQKYLGKCNKGPFDINRTYKCDLFNAYVFPTDAEAKVKADNWAIKKSGIIDRKKQRLSKVEVK